ncbi:MAG: hypothetical protein ACLTER_01685 [Ruminococcus sp.]
MEERYREREEAQQLADMQELQSQLPDVELPEDAETEEPLFPRSAGNDKRIACSRGFRNIRTNTGG